MDEKQLQGSTRLTDKYIQAFAANNGTFGAINNIKPRILMEVHARTDSCDG